MASKLLNVLTWRVCHGHIYRILCEDDGRLVPDDQFDGVYEELLAEHGPAEHERILRDDRGIRFPDAPVGR